MTRDLKKTIEETKVNPKYDLTWNQLRELAKNPELYDIISDSFIYGYAMGIKAAAAEAKKK